MPAIYQKTRYLLELIKFSHSLFALPFALVAYLVATRGKIELYSLLWILVCLVSARSAAMGFNRLVDARMDAQNPRTRSRHLPAGLLSPRFVYLFVFLCSGIFIAAAAQLGRLSFLLAAPCLAVLFFYSLTKRFTHYTQFFLGLSLALAPLGATIAVRNSLSASSLVLSLGVLAWVMGFDLLYALQDLDFDREKGLHSLTVKWGMPRTFLRAKLLHGFFLLCLIAYGWIESFGWLYGVGTGLSAVFLYTQHRLLDGKLEKIQAAFFTANGLLSVFFLIFVAADLWINK